MKQQIMSIFTRTPMHIGAGSSVGVVDQPIIRERHTGYPVIPGSSLKGVLADLWNGDANLERLFGSRDANKAAAGRLLIGEGTIVSFPVRSAKGGFAWIACPLSLGRYFRALGKRVPSGLDFGADSARCYAAAGIQLKKAVILEEYPLDVEGEVPEDIVKTLAGMSEDVLWRDEIGKHLAIVSDDMFAYFVENTCEIAQHVRINDENGTAEATGLFNQENVPSETMFFVSMHEMEDGVLDLFNDKLKSSVNGLVQIGADMTTGLGWCSMEKVN